MTEKMPLICLWCGGGGEDVRGATCVRCHGTGDEPEWAMRIWNGEGAKPPATEDTGEGLTAHAVPSGP